MQPIDPAAVDRQLQDFTGKEVYFHVETTQGAYTKGTTGAFARNVTARVRRAGVAGEGPYRVGVKIEHGWVYAEGLTHWQLDDQGRLLLAGHDDEGHLTVALQLSLQPFPMEGLHDD